MLIKIQKHRLSDDYMIIENARHVQYSDRPISLTNDKDILRHMNQFITEPHNGHREVWYSIDRPGEPSGEVLDYPSGYQINTIKYHDPDRGMTCEALFDGEAYVCNDEGKTIHRIRRGGPLSYGSLDQKFRKPNPLKGS